MGSPTLAAMTTESSACQIKCLSTKRDEHHESCEFPGHPWQGWERNHDPRIYLVGQTLECQSPGRWDKLSGELRILLSINDQGDTMKRFNARPPAQVRHPGTPTVPRQWLSLDRHHGGRCSPCGSQQVNSVKGSVRPRGLSRSRQLS